VEKEVCERFLNKNAGIDIGTNFYKGYVKEVTNEAIILILFNGKEVAIEIDKIVIIREVD